jgi:hypothetical protein
LAVAPPDSCHDTAGDGGEDKSSGSDEHEHGAALSKKVGRIALLKGGPKGPPPCERASHYGCSPGRRRGALRLLTQG